VEFLPGAPLFPENVMGYLLHVGEVFALYSFDVRDDRVYSEK